MTSIGGLENGFAIILDTSSSQMTPQPAPATTTITPEIFEGPVRDTLNEIGAICTEIVPRLKSTATALQQTIDTPAGFTVEQYRQSYHTAITAAQVAREPLLKIITQLRLEISTEKLPLVLWHVHDQVQEIAETLRWGVLRR
jgi:hypothetical protein